MFDDRLKKGVVFRIDTDAAAEFGLDDGAEFAISRDATATEIRASRFKDGKPARGRPRKFPTSAVARMLGFDDLASSEVEEVEETDEVTSEEETSDEEDEARVADLIAGTAAPSADDGEPW